ncbi:MAG TPA: type II toxin-antitoxin system VapC family toxin [Gaiellaceae bacterium]|nr:type II toxin-antitoxin system VapC family toxin [Gaiellaceae bacterium]
MSFLLDTSTVSELRAGHDPNVAAWAESSDRRGWYLSVLTLGEIRKGIEKLRPRDSKRAAAFDQWLEALYRQFDRRLVDVDARVAEEWGRLNAGDPRPTVESLIAATARVHELTVVTRNTADFEPLGVPLVNPWT